MSDGGVTTWSSVRMDRLHRGSPAEFRLLGPVEVVDAGSPLPLGHRKQRSVLAILVVEANRVVQRERLVDHVWDGDPPRSADNLIYGYVARLRSLLAPVRDDASICHRLGGYVLSTDEDRIDLHRFHRLVGDARHGGDTPVAAIRLFDEALGLWRGETLTGVGGDWLAAMRQRIDDERLSATLDRNDLALRLRWFGPLLADLRILARDHPLDERVTGQLMIALHHSGLSGEALAAYGTIRRRLREELGLDPGPWLSTLEQRILNRDQDLIAPLPGTPGGAGRPGAADIPGADAENLSDPPTGHPSRPQPRQLPAPPDRFIGRACALAELECLLSETRSGRLPAGLATVTGMPGIGKTALALHWAHLFRHEFPDGDLYADLRASLPGRRVSPDAVLARFLRALEGPRLAVPDDPDEAGALYRTVLAGRRVLIVLDDVSDAEQVRALLPAAPGSLVIATSRYALPGLVAVDGAWTVRLDPLSDDESHALLVRMLGAVVHAESRAAASLVRACAGLPLALRIALSAVQVPSGHGLAEYAATLEHGDRLSILSAHADGRAALRSSIARTCRALPSELRRTFAVFGLAMEPHLTAGAVAAQLAVPLSQAQAWLSALVDVHLVRALPGGVFGTHELLRRYAAEEADRSPDLPPYRLSCGRRRRAEPVPGHDDGGVDEPDHPADIDHPDHAVHPPRTAQQV